MKKNVFIFKILIIFILVLIAFSSVSNADMGAEPSITINLKNMKTDNYLIDLLIYDETGEKYKSKLDYNGNGEQYRVPSGQDRGYNDLSTITIEELKILHEINYDGWISVGTRWNVNLVFSDCRGNKLHTHEFSYFGTPETYKVLIINNDTGEIKTTDIIHREDFTSNITIDVNEMNVQKSSSFKLVIYTILKAELLTLIIEILIALIMKIKHFKLIILVNLCTNFILQILLMLLPNPYYIVFGILELLVIIAEYMIYKKYIKDESNKKIIAYTIIANLMSGIIIPIIIPFIRKIIITLKNM